MGTKMKCPCNKYLAVEGTLLCECEHAPGRPIIPREQVMEFAEIMEAKLLQNDHKTNWRTLTDAKILDLLASEIQELVIALNRNEPDDAVIRECADVANCVMFLADKRAKWGKVGR